MTAVLRVADVHSLAALVEAVRAPTKGQASLATLALSNEGLTLRWEDDSKALHCSLFVARAAFSAWTLPPAAPRTLALPLAPLADALAVFARLPPADVDIRIPSPSGGLELESGEGGGGVGRTYARVDGAAPSARPAPPPPPPVTGAEASLLAPHALLREAVDDMEWAAAPGRGRVRLRLARDPPAATLSAAASVGALDVALPPSALAAFDMPFAEVDAAYRYRHVRAAFASAPAPRGGGGGDGEGGGGAAAASVAAAAPVSTKLAVDEAGVLRVVHMVPLEGGGGGGGGGLGGAPSAASAVIQFVVLPEAETGDSEGEGG